MHFFWDKGLYPKRIDEGKSSNTKGPNGNEWLHPDLVAVEILFNNNKKWNSNIKTLHKQYSAKRMDIWAFEVKRDLKMSNVRASFFQTLANSSWANYGYLVALSVTKGETRDELKMLCNLHGIGFILLDTEAPEDSAIEIPARKSGDIDWNIANRLASENTHF